MEDAGDRPVTGATIEARTQAGVVVSRTVSSESGEFLLLMSREGLYRLRASRIGLGDGLSAPIEIYRGDTLRVILRMDIQAVKLPALEVVAHSRLHMGRLAGFHYRAERAFGTFLTREDIERRNPVQLSHVLAEHGWDTQAMGSASHRFAVGLQNRRYGCAPTVYIDAVRATGRFQDKASPEAMMEAGEAIGLVHPEEVAGIEIYRGPASVPGEFGGSDARCGVIVIWTR